MSRANGTRRLLRAPLLHFLLIGGALYAANAALQPPPPGPVVRVTAGKLAELEEQFLRQTGRPPNEREREWLIASRVDDELLLEEAFALGWHRSDAIAQRRLLQNQRFLDPDSAASDAELLVRAYEQGMDRSDIVVRRRLLERMRLSIAGRAHAEEPDDEALHQYLERHAEQFTRPERVQLSHVFVSSDRHGERLDDAAAALMVRLVDEAISPDDTAELGDPFLLSRELPLWPADTLASRMGPDFAEGAMRAPVGEWSGPVASSYGLHLVWVRQRSPAAVPALDSIRSRVRASLLREREQEVLRAHLEALRARARVEVE